MIRNLLRGAAAGIGKRTSTGKVGGQIAAKSVLRSAGANPAMPVGMRGSAAARLQASRAAKSAHVQAGKKPLMIAGGLGLAGMSTAMRPNANQSRTSYRGPMQTGRGVGRYS